MQQVWVTKARISFWQKVFSALLQVFEGLERRSGRRLARAFAFLLERCLGAFEAEEPVADPEGSLGPNAPAVHGLCAGDLVAGLRRGRGEVDSVSQDELQVVLVLAAAYLEADEEGAFAAAFAEPAALVEEFRSLRHLALDQSAALRLLPAGVTRAWWRLRSGLGEVEDADRRLVLELAMLRVMRALYALALGLRQFPDNPLLAHREGESALGTRAARTATVPA